ncbi:MAG: PAS domain-containing sensor histidine kinase [Alphaproteobacteria bacterium]|nr:PAS domain-containing sensor histidine kinase [Alphaproteobacteria bacterium]
MALLGIFGTKSVSQQRVGVRLSSFWRSAFGVLVVALALSSALATFLVLANFVPVVPTRDVVISLFAVNGLLIGLLLIMVGVDAYRLLKARRAGLAGSALHARIVSLFAFVAAAPAVLVAIVGWLTLERGIDISFSGQIKELLQTSVEVAKAYQEFQCRAIGREVRLMAADIGQARTVFDKDQAVFREFMRSRSYFLGFFVAIMLKPDGATIERIDNVAVPDLKLPKSEEFAAAEESGDGICLLQADSNIFRALVKIPGFDSNYLLVARTIDPKALQFPQQAELAVRYYDALAEQKLGVQIAFATMYALISLILLLSAVWIGLSFANWLVAPIRRLIFATDQVASGNYDVRVPVTGNEGDLGHLGDTFNKMAAELGHQTENLQTANTLMDQRRRFTEAVLSGVSAGVIGLDGEGRVTVLNPSAEQLLGEISLSLKGQKLAEAIPAFAEFINRETVDRGRPVQGQIEYNEGTRDRSLTVRITSEQASDVQQGAIVTLDDITDLVTAQRTSAWADVARRIAREIKNPLTPIQLSAERIRRKYGKVITTDREIFDQCTDTIIRQVDDIKRMVDEFSSFARMPKPLPEVEDVSSVIRQVLFLMRVAHPEINFLDVIPKDLPKASFDRRLISQALTNIVKNATESILAVPSNERGQGEILVSVDTVQSGILAIEITDNGKGFPTESRQRLLEPYMTTRAGGTGLGLAIVGKIFEDHGGGIELLDRADAGRGARVRLWFPIDGLNAEQTASSPSAEKKQ